MKTKTTKKEKVVKNGKIGELVGIIKGSPPNFSITLNIGGQVYKGEGASALEALQSIPKPAKMSGKGVFFMTDGVKSTREVLMYPLRLRRLFYGKLSQIIQLKSLCLGMK